MSEFEIAVRFATASVLLLLALVLFSGHRNSPAGLLGALLAISAFADQISGVWGSRLGMLGFGVQMVSIGGVLVFWLFAKALFDDEFGWRWRYFWVLVVLEACVLGGFFYTENYTLVRAADPLSFDKYKASLIPQQIMILGLALLAIYEVLKDWRIDLVESRRRFRQVFLLVATALLLWVSFSNFFALRTQGNPYFESMGGALVLLVLIVVLS